MKRFVTFALVCCMLLTLSPFALAEETPLDAVKITCSDGTEIGAENPVECSVSLDDGEENPGKISVYDNGRDAVVTSLPQKNLLFTGDNGSFMLHAGGRDALSAMIAGAVCVDLIGESPASVVVCNQAPVEVWLNGEYQGIYTKRETIQDAVVRTENLDNADTLSISEGNLNAVCGDASGIADAFAAIKALDPAKEDDMKTLETLVDTDNFLSLMAVNSFFGNPNMLRDIYFYQVGGGKIKAAAGDFSWAFQTADADSIQLLVENDGSTADFDSAAMLIGKMLKVPEYREMFLEKLGQVYRKVTPEVMQSAVQKENSRIAAAVPAHCERWAKEYAEATGDPNLYPPKDAKEAVLFRQFMVERMSERTMVRRHLCVYESVQKNLGVSDKDMAKYFGEKPAAVEVSGETWEEWKASQK